MSDLGNGIHRVALPIPDVGLHAVNVYVVEDDDGPYLIDSGQAAAGAREPLEAALRSVGSSLAGMAGFILTHVHRDHYTHAIELRREFGMPVYASAGERSNLDCIRKPENDRYGAQLELLRVCGAPVLADTNTGLSDGVPPDLWEYPDTWLEEGDVLPLSSRTLRVVATPGHTRGHVMLLDDANATAFSGDHVLPHITPSLGFEPVATPRPLGEYMGSLREGLVAEDVSVLPAHGPVFDSMHGRLTELLRHHDDRLNGSLSHLSSAPRTPAEVAKLLTWTRRQRRLDELGPIDQMLAILETKAHLDVLADSGASTRESGDDDVVRFAV